MRNIFQILNDLNIILKDAKIVSLNFDEVKQCAYLALETVFTNERFLFNFKNVGRILSLPANFAEATINFNLNNFAEQISKPKEDNIYELKSFNDASLFFTGNKNGRSFDLV